ncbi:SET domain-containing protein upSET isoform X1 [Rhynchophorus ferrugineus]|uniref:SET domain-containing protein upSET isoform X1 n=1 Tax=Rhynchophorus ferrugineus TaxID=354439 RepID=UPI003FCE198F
MSVCLETSASLVQPANNSALPTNAKIGEIATASESKAEGAVAAPVVSKSIAKLVVSGGQHGLPGTNQVLQKVVSPLITVLNSAGPLTVVKSLCVTSVSSAPQYTLVNSAPLTVTNASGCKTSTIALLTTPLTVVKAINAQSADKPNSTDVSVPISGVVPGAPAILENRGHNVFVKNTTTEPAATDGHISQGHKLLTASSFAPSNVLNSASSFNKSTTVNGQRNKVKILSNMHIPGPSQSSVVLNKPPTAAASATQRPGTAPSRPKLSGANGAPTKYIAKQITTNIFKSRVNSVKALPEKPSVSKPTPSHQTPVSAKPTPLKIAPVNNFVPKQLQTSNAKTLSPQHKVIPGQIQRTGSGLRTIPPQRPQKLPNRPNYIGKHAVQALKVKQLSYAKMKAATARTPSGSSSYHSPPVHEKQLSFNQALTAQIIETLSNSNSPAPTQSNRYEILPSRYDNAFKCPDRQEANESSPSSSGNIAAATSHAQADDHQQSSKLAGLDALSLICQAVLLDHNYNATLPSDSPPRVAPQPPTQINGMACLDACSPGQLRRRPPPSCGLLSASSHSNLSLAASNSASLLSSAGSADDDAASDISDCSDRKHDTEGEETDTAPEVEDVKNDDHYGDYVTRCICGFLHDDGYMVECDRCKVWQHVQCVVKNRQIPDEYLCEVCDPSKPVDRQKARIAQQQWMRERQLLEPKIRKEAKLKDALRQKDTGSDSESSDGEQPPRNNNVAIKNRALVGRKKAELVRGGGGGSSSRRDSKDVAAVPRRPKRKERKIVKRKTKLHSRQQAGTPAAAHSDDENQDSWSSHLPQLRQWIEKYEEAVTNHYSPELRARISSIRVNGAHVDSTVQYDASVCRCRVHTQPLTEIKYLVSTAQLSPDTPVIELRGKYMLSTQHRHAGGSFATRQHTQRPGPFLFFYKLQKDNTEVCVDTRTYGNSARFIRRSCRPNAELRHCIEKGVLHLYVVAIATVEKNSELTIKHESHDLAAVGTTQIACACGRPDECAVNKTTIKRNGETSAAEAAARKRRGRRTTSTSGFAPAELRSPVKEHPQPVPQSPATMPPVSSTPAILPAIVPETDTKEIKEEKIEVEETVEVKLDVKEEPKSPVKVELKQEVKSDDTPDDSAADEPKSDCPLSPVKVETVKRERSERREARDEKLKSPNATPIVTRRSSHYKSDKEDSSKETDAKEQQVNKSKKLSREERKLEAILRAIEQMEKADQKKQEHQAKQAHRRESEPGPNFKEDERQEPKVKRRRRRGRARTTSTNAHVRRSRLNSTDSYITSGDENMLSPNDGMPPHRPAESSGERAADLLLALSNGQESEKHAHKSPTSNGESTTPNHSSPETPQLSSACLLVQAAVEPLESGFKFPKTKKGLMNEWLNKVPESAAPVTSISPSPLATNAEDGTSYGSSNKNLAALAQAASFCDNMMQPRGGNAKKRWLRQAISEDHSNDSPSNRAESPPISEAVAPPKKRRLPRESLSSDNSPPNTPTGGPAKVANTPRSSQEGCVEIVYSGAEGDSPGHTMESDTELKERAAQMKQEFEKVTVPTPALETVQPRPAARTLLDPRLSRENSIFSSSELLVGTVEKTLSILGFESKPGSTTPAKRKVKLSITEYRQRKKLNTDKTDEPDAEQETHSAEDNSSESFKPESATRPRSGSSSSSTSFTSGDELPTSELVVKAPAFNSEPTELERQREISSMRLKKAFGLATDDDARKPQVLNVSSILSCELEPRLRTSSPQLTNNPGFSAGPICDRSMSPTPKAPETADGTHTPVLAPVPTLPSTTAAEDAGEPEEDESVERDADAEEERTRERETPVEAVMVGAPTTEEDKSSNLFYTPDDDEDREVASFEGGPEAVNYVPPFNNPVYPNNNFTSFTSSIDDDSRYQSRNPSPPPELEGAPFSSSL